MIARVAGLAVVLAAAAASPLAQQDATSSERYTAFAVSPGGPRTGSVATQVEFTIDRWSTAEESQKLTGVLKEQGAEALLDALRDLKPVGTISTPGSLAYDLRYAHQTTRDGTRRIVLATDRPISFWEAVNRPRTIEYPFTFIELRVDENGQGVGKLNLATRITSTEDGRMLTLENYDAQPIQLNEVRRQSQ